jgi:hypothetical protein
MRSGESFQAVISGGQLERMKRVVSHNGGEILGSSAGNDGITITIVKTGAARD